jgi:hypothetical protein
LAISPAKQIDAESKYLFGGRDGQPEVEPVFHLRRGGNDLKLLAGNQIKFTLGRRDERAS